MKCIFPIIISIVIFQSCGANQGCTQDNIVVSQQHSILEAEKFVQENGYSSYPPDKSKISYELLKLHEKDVDSNWS